MKLGLFFLLVISSSLLHSEISDSTIRISDELTIEKIEEDVYIVIHSFPWPANSMLVRCAGDVLIWVDTPYNDEATEQVLDWIKTEFGEIRIVEINTGYHNDNLGGNGCLRFRSDSPAFERTGRTNTGAVVGMAERTRTQEIPRRTRRGHL